MRTKPFLCHYGSISYAITTEKAPIGRFSHILVVSHDYLTSSKSTSSAALPLLSDELDEADESGLG